VRRRWPSAATLQSPPVRPAGTRAEEKESHMSRDEENLLYPLDTGDDPVCLRCGTPAG